MPPVEDADGYWASLRLTVLKVREWVGEQAAVNITLVANTFLGKPRGWAEDSLEMNPVILWLTSQVLSFQGC